MIYHDLEHMNADASQIVTTYNLTIAYREDGKATQFVLTESRNNEGPQISDTLILKTARAMAHRFGLEPHQLTVYAEQRDGDFAMCSFKKYDKPEPLDFSAGDAKILISREKVEDQIAEKLPEAAQRNLETPSLDNAYFPSLKLQ